MIHELFPDFMGANSKTARDKKIAVKNADHIICISESTKRDAIELLNICESKVSVVHLGVDTFRESATNSHVDPTPNYHPYILYVGERGGYKNFSCLLKVVAQTAKLKRDFQIIAFGGGAFSRHEHKEIHALGLTDRHVINISCNDSLLQMYYKNASAFVYPSLYEGFGLPPLEAMSAGCPVISSNTSSMPEIISDAAEFFNPEDIECFAQALEAVVYSEERRADLVVRGYKRVQALSWNKCAQQTLNVYEKLS
jgi:glycosyltransferase involved in cell wall biosynthesis